MSDAGTERMVMGCVDLVAELLREPLDRFPVQQVSDHLRDCVDADFVAWNYVSQDARRVGYLSDGAEVYRDAAESWLRDVGVGAHPLLRWYARTGSTAPQTAARVPTEVADRRAQAAYASFTRSLGGHRQLSVPVPLGSDPDDAIVLCRNEADFTDGDLRLVRRVQPLLVGVRRQIEARARWTDAHGERGPGGPDRALGATEAAGLTPRELCVLQLLSEGCTQRAVAHQLGVSPRTVHKHVEHLYAKLGVSDRLLAVLRARDLGVLPQQRRAH